MTDSQDHIECVDVTFKNLPGVTVHLGSVHRSEGHNTIEISLYGENAPAAHLTVIGDVSEGGTLTDPYEQWSV